MENSLIGDICSYLDIPPIYELDDYWHKEICLNEILVYVGKRIFEMLNSFEKIEDSSSDREDVFVGGVSPRHPDGKKDVKHRRVSGTGSICSPSIDEVYLFVLKKKMCSSHNCKKTQVCCPEARTNHDDTPWKIDFEEEVCQVGDGETAVVVEKINAVAKINAEKEIEIERMRLEHGRQRQCPCTTNRE
jgi:hypothetical protein